MPVVISIRKPNFSKLVLGLTGIAADGAIRVAGILKLVNCIATLLLTTNASIPVALIIDSPCSCVIMLVAKSGLNYIATGSTGLCCGFGSLCPGSMYSYILLILTNGTFVPRLPPKLLECFAIISFATLLFLVAKVVPGLLPI